MMRRGHRGFKHTGPGWVYAIALNDGSGLTKIGMTSLEPEQRGLRLICDYPGKFGDLIPLRMVASPTERRDLDEFAIRARLAAHRWERTKDFFAVSLEEAISVIAEVSGVRPEWVKFKPRVFMGGVNAE